MLSRGSMGGQRRGDAWVDGCAGDSCREAAARPEEHDGGGLDAGRVGRRADDTAR